jgi:hypothetical protein
MNRRDRRTLKSIERRARRAVDKVVAAKGPSPRVEQLIRHANGLHRQAVSLGLTIEPD